MLFIVLFYLSYFQCMESSEINIQKYLSKLITSRIDIKTAESIKLFCIKKKFNIKINKSQIIIRRYETNNRIKNKK